ncbi:hypothetical protein HHL11_03205 [Ramlibacter sp. G-1-2-2]|uniref:DUF3108 domain-containing protein n=1 Tax=Ramlibacter agri TaxID=2728837 RepID=A0A848GWL6_9BURK|nr:hypothetical protein [Ramlibacter agri]
MRLVRVPALAAALLATAAAAAPERALRFDEAFAEAPVSLHYQAEYQARGASHQLEAWVDRGLRLKRVTDGQVESYAVRASAHEPEYRMTVLDLRRRISTRIDRSNLFRIGSFTDWFELAHALRHPRGDYQLARVSAPAGAGKPLAACDWYQLTQEGRASKVCWSQAAALPLSIVSDEGQEVWRVTQLQRGPVRASVFEVHDRDFVRNDANGDIEKD